MSDSPSPPSEPSPSPDDERPLGKAELYSRIRKSSKSQVILEEMVRLGFWGDSSAGSPAMTAEWVEQRGELTRELSKLVKKQARYKDREAALHDMRKKRMADARRKREETKQRREEERQAKARLWQEKQRRDVVYLGEGVSGGLSSTDEKSAEDNARLADQQLPAFSDPAALAAAMGIELGELRFLAFQRKVSKVSHYRRFFMPKKTGGKRLISAPMPRLKAAQTWILENLLNPLPVHDAAHGFVAGRSIVTNASAHVGCDVVINWDLKDFFPTVTYRRVKGLFQSLGYSEKIATIFGLICTEADAEQVELDGELFHVQRSDRHLPQGAPTSPAITNLLCRRFDARMLGVATQLGFTYTRYADDLSFSASGSDANSHIRRLLWRVQAIVTEEGFHVHPDKLRIMRKGGRQEVTGLTVNEKLGVPRDDLRRFRALVYQVEKDGPGGKKWRNSEAYLLATLYGYANFICMVDAEKGAPVRERVKAILARHGWQHEVRHSAKVPETTDSSGSSGQPEKSFWQKLQFWKK